MASACAAVVAPATGARASSTRRTPAVSSSSRVAARWHTRQVFPAVERSELCRRLWALPTAARGQCASWKAAPPACVVGMAVASPAAATPTAACRLAGHSLLHRTST